MTDIKDGDWTRRLNEHSEIADDYISPERQLAYAIELMKEVARINHEDYDGPHGYGRWQPCCKHMGHNEDCGYSKMDKFISET